MLPVVRRKLAAMAVRVWDFFYAHTSSEGHQYVLGQLEEKITRADALQAQQRGGLVAEHEAVSRRLELRRRLSWSSFPTWSGSGRWWRPNVPTSPGRF